MLLYMIIGFVVSMLFTFFLMPHVLRFCKEKHLYDMRHTAFGRNFVYAGNARRHDSVAYDVYICIVRE